MAISTFGVDETVLLQYLQNFSLSRNATGGDPEYWINWAASKVGTALRKSGRTPSAITSADYPEAYEICKDVIALFAAARWTGSFFHMDENGNQAPIKMAAEAGLEAIEKDSYLGEMAKGGVARHGKYKHRGDTDKQMRDNRTEWTDEP